jgi:CRP-like cAMP-binding protein
MPEPFDPSTLGEAESSELTLLLGRCPDVQPLVFRDGEYLIREGDEEQHLFIVARGAFTVERPSPAGGAPAILDSVICHPSSVAIVGEMAYFGMHPRSASVRSTGATYALRLEPQHITVVIEGFPILTRVICQQFARRLRQTNDTIRDLRSRFILPCDKRLATAGEVLFKAGDPPAKLFQLAAGAVRLREEGRDELVEPQDLPDGFLEAGTFLRNQPYAAMAVVEDSALLAIVDAAHKETLLRCHPGLALRLFES